MTDLICSIKVSLFLFPLVPYKTGIRVSLKAGLTISGQCFHFTTRANTRKIIGFLVFSGGMK